MTSAGISQPVELARAEIERACQCLLHPAAETLEQSLFALGSAVAHLQAAGNPCRGNPQALAQADRLREAIRRAGFLLNTASEYHAGWLRILRARMAGYTAEGAPGEVRCASRISVEG
jgi:hypothetical protein